MNALPATGRRNERGVVLAVVLAVLVVLVYPLEGALSSWLVPNKRTIWDRVAGTRVRYRRLTSSGSAPTDTP